MAQPEEIAALRLMINEPTQDPYSDVALSALIDTGNGLNHIASTIWYQKAAKASTAVDISEAGSSRKMSDLFTHAMEMAKKYGDLADAEDLAAAELAAQDWSKTRAIVRP
jgi:hypothetical protein